VKHLRGAGHSVEAGGLGEGGRTQAGLGSLGFGSLLFSSLSLIGSLAPPVPASCVVYVAFTDAPSLGTMIATSQHVFVVRTR
jgi:hypothetical protein